MKTLTIIGLILFFTAIGLIIYLWIDYPEQYCEFFGLGLARTAMGNACVPKFL